jgi:Clp amino terminal domain, pathogenicity island component
MNTRTKKLATLLTVGVVLSSGAYALGSQAGSGGALASGSNASASGSSSSAGGSAGVTNVSDNRGPGRAGLRGGGFGLDNLASKLGVSETALENALKAIRDAKTPEQRRAELTQAFATALGKTPEQVTAALNSVLPDRPDRDKARGQFAADLAKALGVDAAKVQAGLDKARQDFQGQQGRRDRRGNIDTVVNDIASATGVDAAKVRSALQSLRPKRADRRDRRDRGDDIRQKLATALGVTTAQLDAAFDKVRTQAADQFATELAQRLNIDVQKVKDALPDGRGGFFGFGFGGHRHG